MNSDDHRDQLVDMLLREVVGGETPPDVRERVLSAVDQKKASPSLRPLRSPSGVGRNLGRRSSGPGFAIAALLLLSLIALALTHFQRIDDSRTPQLSAVTGEVNRKPGPLHSGAIIRTGSDSEAVLLYADGTEVVIAAETEIHVAELSLTNRSKTLWIERGRIDADVEPQGTRYPMTLSSSHARSIVVGTQLSIVAEKTHTRLEVTEGEVRLEPKNKTTPVHVKGGEFAEADHSPDAPRSGKIAPAVIPTPPIVRQEVEPPPAPPVQPEPEPEPAKPSIPGKLTGFTLMNADTDKAVVDRTIGLGQTLYLSKLSTPRISLRAIWTGEKPFSVHFTLNRLDDPKGSLGVKKIPGPQHHEPFFLTGDYSAEGRPEDCRPWEPEPGIYRITATPSYKLPTGKEVGETYTLDLTIAP